VFAVRPPPYQPASQGLIGQHISEQYYTPPAIAVPGNERVETQYAAYNINLPSVSQIPTQRHNAQEDFILSTHPRIPDINYLRTLEPKSVSQAELTSARAYQWMNAGDSERTHSAVTWHPEYGIMAQSAAAAQTSNQLANQMQAERKDGRQSTQLPQTQRLNGQKVNQIIAASAHVLSSDTQHRLMQMHCPMPPIRITIRWDYK